MEMASYGNYWILRIGVIGRCQKSGIILENEVIQKLIFFNEKKKLQKILMIFDVENWFWKSQNLSNFVPPAWELDNPYYHSVGIDPIKQYLAYAFISGYV